MSTTIQREGEDTRDEEPDVGSYGRVWQRWDPTKGSSQLTLKAMAVLYDAGQPLTVDEFVDRLLPRLDAYARAYLEAWWLRRRDQDRTAARKTNRLHEGKRSLLPSLTAVTPEKALRRWLMAVFRLRSQKGGQSLRYEGGRFSPGPRPPRVLRVDGTLVAFTPEQRHELERTEHDDGRGHIALVEWKRATAHLDLSTLAARAQLLMYFTRRFLIGSNTKPPMDERLFLGLFNTLLKMADTPGAQRIVLQYAFDELWGQKPERDDHEDR